MANLLTLKLEQFVRFSAQDRATLDDLARVSIRTIDARHDMIAEGDEPKVVNIILEGWACRYKMLEDGRRQTFAFLLPGDLCDLNVYTLREMDHSIGALSKIRYAQLPRQIFDEVLNARPRILQAFWWDSLVSAAIQREWTVNLGRRDARERIAHLFCELFYRLQSVGLTHEGSFTFPVTQVSLADVLGMTSVHINRVVQELRSQGLVEWKGREVHIPNLSALQEIAFFTPNYLHLDHEGRHLDANE